MNLVTISLGFLRMWKSILGEGEREGEEKSFGEEDYHNKMKLFWDAIPNEKLSEKIIMILMIIIKEGCVKIYLSSTKTVKKLIEWNYSFLKRTIAMNRRKW